MAVTIRRPGLAATLVAAGALAIAGCGGASEPTALATESTLRTVVAAPSTTAEVVTTTASPSTTGATTTTVAAPTTTTSTLPRQLTTPIDPPLDADAAEPVIEMGRIAIPRIGVDVTMYEGIRNTTLDFGPGHWPGSGLPGQTGNVVVAGHRTSKHRVFHDIDQLVEGDEIVFTADDGTAHVYLVTDVEIVGPEAIWIVDPTDTATVTLFACHPPGSTAQRIVVRGDLTY